MMTPERIPRLIRFWTKKDGVDFEAQTLQSRRWGFVRKCGKCRRGVIAHGDYLLRTHCLVCGGGVRRSIVAIVKASELEKMTR